MPAFGAAVAMGAEEIEFDIWATKDGEIVSCHDSTLDRVSTGTGNIWDYTYAELLKFDFGVKHGERFKGLKIVKFEEILKKFACHTIMNIHVKIWDTEQGNTYMEKIVGLIRQYDCEKWVYFMSGNDKRLREVKAYAPDLKICVGAGSNAWGIVDRAIELGAEKVQLCRPYFNKEMVNKAHANGIVCNVFWADEEEKAKEYLDMGIDCILTNDYNAISQIVDEYKKK
jgi:glycerophosphoryl diester phosphodiesterase